MTMAFTMPSAWLTKGEEQSGQSNYRCAMNGCKRPVYWKSGFFWHHPNTPCTHDPEIIHAVEHAHSVVNGGMWYVVKCSECKTGELPLLFQCPASAVRVCGRGTVPCDAEWANGNRDTLELYDSIYLLIEYGHPTPAVYRRMVESLGLAISINEYGLRNRKTGEYSLGTKESPAECHSTRMYLCCRSCMSVRSRHASIFTTIVAADSYSSKLAVALMADMSSDDMVRAMMQKKQKKTTTSRKKRIIRKSKPPTGRCPLITC